MTSTPPPRDATSAQPTDAPPPSDLAARVEQLEKQAKAAPAPAVKRKDVWDVVQILGSALIPIAIAAGGWFYSQATSRAQIENARQQHERDSEIARAEARVKQAGLLKDFLEALTGDNVAKRRVAIQAVLLALPQDGPQLVREISQSASDPTEAAFAKAALSDRCQVLVQRLFGPVAEDRIAASAALLDGWRESPVLLDKLLPYARQHLANGNGVYNALGVLTEVSPAVLVSRKQEVESFLTAAESAPAAGERIRGLAATVRRRLR